MPNQIKNQAPIRSSTWKEFVLQIFISVEGPNIFVIPALFKEIGVFVGIVTSFLVGVFYTNAIHSYVNCADEMSRRRNVPRQSLYMLPQMVFEEISCPKIGYYLRMYLKYEIIISWCLSLSLQWQFVVENLKLILSYFDYTPDDFHILLSLFIPLVLISWIPSFKYIAYLSYIVTVSLALVTGVIVYYLIYYPPAYVTSEMFEPLDLTSLVTFTSYMFITISFTPLVFPLKNEMKNPQLVGRAFGPMTIITIVMIALNCAITLLVYIQIGDDVAENLFNNLPRNTTVLVTNCIFTLLAMASMSPSLLVIVLTIWNGPLRRYFSKFRHVKVYEYLVRSLICVFITLGVILVPSFKYLIHLITFFSFPFDSILLPAILEVVVGWSDSKKRSTTRFKVVCLKNFIVCVIALVITTLSFIVCLTELTPLPDNII